MNVKQNILDDIHRAEQWSDFAICTLRHAPLGRLDAVPEDVFAALERIEHAKLELDWAQKYLRGEAHQAATTERTPTPFDFEALK